MIRHLAIDRSLIDRMSSDYRFKAAFSFLRRLPKTRNALRVPCAGCTKRAARIKSAAAIAKPKIDYNMVKRRLVGLSISKKKELKALLHCEQATVIFKTPHGRIKRCIL